MAEGEAGVAWVPLSAPEIYERINGGPGSGKLSEAQQIAQELGRDMDDAANDLFHLATEVEEGWQGEAGRSASNAAGPVAQASMMDGMLLQMANTAANDQIGAFDTVRNSVVPVSAERPPLSADDFATAISTGDFGAYDRKVEQWNADANNNIRAYGVYHEASMSNGESVPAEFAELTDPGAAISLAERGGTAQDAAPRTTGAPAPVIGGGTPAPTGSPGYQPTPASPPAPGHQPSPGPGTPGTASPSPSPYPVGSPVADNSTTTSSAYAQAPSATPPGGPDYRFGPPGTPGTSPNPGTPYSPTGTGPYPGTGSGNPASGNPGGNPGVRGVPGVGVPGAGRVPGAPGGQVPGGQVPGGQVPGGQAPGGGRFSGTLPPTSGPAGGTPGTSGAAGAGGRPGMAGMPMGAGGKGKGGEDEEHQRKYGNNPDPDDLFGTYDDKASPPVIGEHPPRGRQR